MSLMMEADEYKLKGSYTKVSHGAHHKRGVPSGATMDVDPPPRCWALSHACLPPLPRTRQAQELLNEAVKQNPDNPVGYSSLGEIQARIHAAPYMPHHTCCTPCRTVRAAPCMSHRPCCIKRGRASLVVVTHHLCMCSLLAGLAQPACGGSEAIRQGSQLVP